MCKKLRMYSYPIDVRITHFVELLALVVALVGRKDIWEHRHKKSPIDHRLAVAEGGDKHFALAGDMVLAHTPSVAAVDPFSI